MSPEAHPLGAIMAGGRNTRYGAPKALELVGGARIIDRVMAALKEATPDLVLIANDQSAYATVPLPARADERPGAGALGGIHSALRWGKEQGRPGILAVACDMPFVSGQLLVHLLNTAGSTDADVVAPESGSRRGLEPLCAYYSQRCVGAIEDALDHSDFRMIGFHEHVQVHTVPLAQVRRFGIPEVLFMNVNTPEERQRAEALAVMMRA